MRRFAAFVTMLVLGVGSTSAAPRVAHPWTRPGELRIAMLAEPGTLDPLLQLNDYENFVTRLAFDQLVTVDADGRTLVPRLASVVPTLDNGGIARDGKRITWHLRRDVRWHDGVRFTSRDVAYSFAAIADPKHNIPNRRGFDLIASVATPDPYTVIVRLREPFAPGVTWFFGDGSQYAIVPAHALEREADFNRAAFNTMPIGTGPFRVVRWRHGQQIDLERFDGYYGARAKLAKISVHFVPDEAVIVNQLRTHEIDLATLLTPSGYGLARDIPSIAFALTPIHGAINVVMNTSHQSLRDVRVRRAVAFAIDKAALIRKLTFGAGSIASADLPDFMWAHDPSLRPIRFDPERARALLREAGYAPGPDGIVARNGHPLSLVFAYSGSSATARAASVQIQASLRAVGIDAVLKSYDSKQLYAGFAAGGIFQNGTFDLAYYGMTLGIDPDTSGRFSCRSIPPGGQNYSRYCNRQVDAAERAGLATFDRAARARAYAIVQRRLLDDVPMAYLWYEKNVDAYNDDLHGFRPNPITASWNAETWTNTP